MIFKSLLCLIWAAAVAASSILNSLDNSVASSASSSSAHLAFATSGISSRSVGAQKRTDSDTQICDPSGMDWFTMVAAYAITSLGSMMGHLKASFSESDMTMEGIPELRSSPYDPNRVYCDFFPKANDSTGTSFPRCLLETAIDNFCTVSTDTWMNSSHPMSTNNRGGRWTTYKFTGYLISGLYVGAEFNKEPKCDSHQRALYAYNNTPDRRYKEQLMGQIVDRCLSIQSPSSTC